MNDFPASANHQEENYPAMSHPPGHPAVMAATALLGGLRLSPIRDWHILEIGCASGHHILPIAAAYPHTQITAIDLSASAIAEAQRLAALAGITNVKFLCADVMQWQAPKEAFDAIIAHGVFSWVNDQIKSALLQLCQRSLKKQGVAMLSYNTQPGWALRQPLREMALTLRQIDGAQGSALSALQWMESALDQRVDRYGQYLLEIVRDTQAKGEQQLKFDDLAPVNDPCYFSQFVHWCEQAGLTYVGEADSTLAQTSLLSSTAQAQLLGLANNPLLHEQMTDFLTGRTFRCSVICRNDATRIAPTAEEITTLCIEALMPVPPTGNAATDTLGAAIFASEPSCLSMSHLLQKAPSLSPQEAISISLRLLQLGMIRLRSEPIVLPDEMPSHPKFSALNQDHLATGKAIVDAFHRPCLLSPTDRAWLRACDGSHSFEQLMKRCPNDEQVEACHALLAHLHRRGLFV